MTEIKKMKSQSQNELDQLQAQFDAHEQNIKDLTLERTSSAPRQDVEQQTRLSSREIDKSRDIYLKPEKTVSCRDKFNEKFREDYNYSKEYVQFIAENREIIGETLELWTRPFGGMPAEFWKVPPNKPVWGPRYLAEQIKKCCYHRFQMQQSIVESNNTGQIYGSMVADTTIQRLDAIPINTRKSVFLGASNF
jgi:hypothetical protein